MVLKIYNLHIINIYLFFDYIVMHLGTKSILCIEEL